MKRFLLITFSLILCAITSVNAQNAYVPGELIVQFDQGVRADDLTKDLFKMQGKVSGLRVLKTLSDNQNILLLAYNSKDFSPNYVLDKVRGHQDVLLVQFNHYVEERLNPNDPFLTNQWHHSDASDNDIDSELAWDITTGGLTQNGDEIVVCVIEGGGSNYNHTDLIANHWTNSGEIPGNGIDDDANGYIDDFNGWNPVTLNDNVGSGGHGTAVSGMIGAKGNNSIGGVGVNWDVKIMQVGLGSLTESNVISSYEYAYDMRNLYNTTGGAQGAFVVATNASWGIDNANPSSYPVWCAYYDALGAVGILNCGATANNNVNVDVVGDMPTGCSSDYMVAVTATNSSDVRTFSGYGVTTIDLGAPGESVYLPSGSSGYSSTSGTSFASPCVAGAIALMYSAPCSDLANLALANPQAAADLVRTYLFQGVDPVANLATEVATGGRLNVFNSINLLLGNCGPLPPCEPATIALNPTCYYNEISSNVESGIELTISLTENFCDVEQICYRANGTGAYTCLDLSALGFTVNNNLNTFLLQNLLSSTPYEVYYTTADGTSSVASTSTLNCSSEIPGCTDVSALNYDAAATFDDGSCTYPCVTVNLDILTDCWGEETSWSLTDAGGNTIASSPTNAYGDQINYNWNQCMETGCYTFTIFDSYGDGVNGAQYQSCGVNGDYSITDAYGNTLVQMANANFGAQAVHEFCVTYVDLDGCTDISACNYSPGASNDDGSCEYTSCLGCTDPLADNYDPLATIDDGSCIVTCQLHTLTLFTDCFAGETSWSLEDDGATIIQQVASGTYANLTSYTYDFCLSEGCYTINIDDTYGDGLEGTTSGCAQDGNYTITDALDNVVVAMPVANFGFGTSHTFCVVGDLEGCTNAAACNYDSDATIDDGSCTLATIYFLDVDGDGFGDDANTTSSCSAVAGYVTVGGDCDDSNELMYPGAPPTAEGIDNDCSGEVDPDEALAPCVGDFNNDNERNIADLLLMLSEFGCNTAGCVSDMNGDDLVNTGDLAAFLSVFGTPCD